MRKSVPKMRRLVLPVALSCLPLQPLLANSLAALETHYSTPAAGPVTGRIVDEKGVGLPGVNVLVKGTNVGTATNADGRYTIEAPDGATLVFSYVGYASQEVAVSGRATVDVALAPISNSLNDVVVVGYLTENRQNVTSAVSSLDTREAAKTPVPTLAQAIQGRVPGVQVQGTGTPGAVPNIVIRGVGSIAAGSQPLYVIDGLWTDNIRDLSPNDIETATVLKDASSTAVYGSRGANGVILITTKRGAAGAPKISFNGYYGVESIYKRYNLANNSQWADQANLAFLNAGQDPLVQMPGAVKAAGGAYNNNVDTDWQKEFFQNGKVQDYNLTFSGGTSGEKSSSNFLIGAGYFNQQGIVKGPAFERYSLRLNSGLRRGRLRVNESALLTHINTTLLNGNPFIDVLTELPGIPVYDPNNLGGFGYGSSRLFNYSTNPVGGQLIRDNTQNNNRLQGSANLQFDITSYLSYKLNVSLEMHDFTNQDARRQGYLRLGESTPITDYLFVDRGTQTTLLVENTLNFTKHFGEHGVNAVVGYSEQKYNYRDNTSRATGFAPPYQFVLSAATNTSPPIVTGLDDYWAKRSFFGQATYDYKNRYLVTGSVRRDGSSRFDPDNRYGNFGAGSVGWRISEEDFFKNAVPVINNLKLRASYGVNGNDGLPNSYLYQAVVNPNVNYVLGSGQVVTNGAVQTALASKGIHWESRYTKDAGLDVALLNNRLTLSADYYISETKGALQNPLLPAYDGVSGSILPYNNVGNIRNQGFELAVGYHETKNEFTYGADLSFSTLKNEVTALSDFQPTIPGGQGLTRTEVGHPIGQLYLLPALGIFQNQAEIDNYKNASGALLQPGSKPGDVKYQDSDGDGVINSGKDRVYVGTPYPRFQYGLNLSAAYKGFDISVFLQGVQGNSVYNATRAALDQFDGRGNIRSDANPWTVDNPSSTTPRVVANGGNGPVTNNFLATTRWVEDGSYFRLRNIQIGYTLPKGATNFVPGLGSIRVYLTGRNVFTVTKYTGFDPETPGIDAFQPGIDLSSYPNVRAFTGGLQANF